MKEKLDSGFRSIGRMTTGKDDKGFLSFPPALAPSGAGLVGNPSLETYNSTFH
ncbi:MAG: hypothetical protein V3R54_09140 [Thermodesulfovibrionia bacterium]